MKQKILSEINLILEADEGRVGDTFRIVKDGVLDAKEIVSKTGGGNTGGVYIYKQIIRSVQEEYLPSSSSICLQTARTIRRLLKKNTNLAVETKNYLLNLESKLNEKATEKSAIEIDLNRLDSQSNELYSRAKLIENAIYVYSFPTYIHYGVIDNPDYIWVKIGRTSSKVLDRVISQNRETAMPEEPKLLRIYHKDKIDLQDVETKFHNTLRSVGHRQSSYTHKKAGNEWYATSLEALDALANLMDLKIEKDSKFDYL